MVDPAYLTHRLGAAAVRNLPGPIVDALGDLGGRAAAWMSPERRLLVQRNLERALGRPLGPGERVRLVDESFRSYARYYAEAGRLPDLDVAEVDAGFTVEGFAHIEDARATGTGPMLILPHLGGWEWAGFWLSLVPNCPVTAVVEPLEPPELHEWFVDLRQRLNMHIVPIGPGAGGALVRAIKANHVVCLLADRDVVGGGIPVEFFGETTTLPAGPATLALRTGARLLPTGVYFADDIHHAVVRPPVPIERSGSFRADVANLTQKLAHELEALIRRAPEQWHLMQPNWPSDRTALARLRRSRT